MFEGECFNVLTCMILEWLAVVFMGVVIGVCALIFILALYEVKATIDRWRYSNRSD